MLPSIVFYVFLAAVALYFEYTVMTALMILPNLKEVSVRILMTELGHKPVFIDIDEAYPNATATYMQWTPTEEYIDDSFNDIHNPNLIKCIGIAVGGSCLCTAAILSFCEYKRRFRLKVRHFFRHLLHPSRRPPPPSPTPPTARRRRRSRSRGPPIPFIPNLPPHPLPPPPPPGRFRPPLVQIHPSKAMRHLL